MAGSPCSRSGAPRRRSLFDVPPSAFVPPPKITSSVVHLVPRPAPGPCRTADLERVTAAAFGQRRKMLRSSLKSLGVDVDSLLVAAGIEPSLRAEDVPVEGFVRMAAALPCLRARCES
jgi:16S rRNA (adenine1518-N6/adenine1519-N6)-dimethyltransferase